MEYFEQLLVAGAVLILISVLASKGAQRVGIPALLVFIGIGMLAGSDGIGGIQFDDYEKTKILGIVALIFILFAGGLDTQYKKIRPYLKSGVSLSTLGVVLATGMIGVFASNFLGFNLLEGLLLGATVASTDVAAVFTVLRSQKIGLKDGIQQILELESGLNDPMTVFLTIGFIELMTQQNTSYGRLVFSFFQEMGIGFFVGLVLGYGQRVLINWLNLEFEGLYPVLSLALVLLIYGTSQVLGGSGFLSVYVAGIVLANSSFLHKKSLTLFHDGLAWLMQIAMFLVMGLLVFPKDLIPVAGAGFALSAFLVFVARPLSVHICLWPTPLKWREKWMISWAGLRGAAPIILATYPLLAGVPKSGLIFNLVFFVVFTSVLFQGTLMSKVARWLKVDAPLKEQFRSPIEYNPTTSLKNEMVEIFVPANSPIVGRSLLDLRLPGGALVVLIQRKGDVIVPRGGTQIRAEDKLLILAEQMVLPKIQTLVQVSLS